MKKIVYLFSLVFLSTAIFAGCASIVSKSAYPVTINSQPDQAEIAITDETGKTVHTGKTPTTVTLDTKRGYFKGKDYTVKFSKEGYAEYSAPIKRGVDGWYIAGNILFGGLIGWLIVDPLTGAMWTLPENLTVTLSKRETSLNKDNMGLRIVLFDDLPENMRSKLVRID